MLLFSLQNEVDLVQCTSATSHHTLTMIW